MQLCVCFFVKSLPEYKPITWFQPKIHAVDYTQILCFENTVLFTFANFQYIIVALIFSVGKPYRFGTPFVTPVHAFIISNTSINNTSLKMAFTEPQISGNIEN